MSHIKGVAHSDEPTLPLSSTELFKPHTFLVLQLTTFDFSDQ